MTGRTARQPVLRAVARAGLGVVLLCLVGCDAGMPGNEHAARPNLLLITLDTTRADALGAYGQARPTSPNVDRLARRGVLFEQAATSNPETLPAHSTIFTGEWPYVHGVRSNAGYVLSESRLTLAEVLRDHGYATGAEVAAPVLRRETRVTQGFDHYRGAESPGVELEVVRYERGAVREEKKMIRVGSDITARGIDFLRAHRHEPFFLWLHYFDAHNPYAAPARWNALIPDSPYHAEVAWEDQQVGLVLLELERLGLEESTLVVLTADHGEGLMDHGEPSHSFFVYDATMHVPLVFAGPDLPHGLRIPSLVRTVDVAPTILELLGLPPLEAAQGVSLVPLIRGEKEDLGLTAYGEATRFTADFGLPPIRFVREGRWKYIHKVSPELYDVLADPGEQTNLAARAPERVEALRGRLEAMVSRAPEPRDDAQAALDRQTAMQLMALGYVARSPAFAIEDEGASLALEGDDPNAKLDDVRAISTATGLLQRGDFERALEMLEPLLERNPESPFAMDLVSQALVGLGRYEEGIALLRGILARDPADSQAGYGLASALRAQDRPAEAVQVLEDLLARNPCDERVQLELHALLREQARYAELVQVLGAGAERCPDLLSNLNNYAWALATLPDDDRRDGARALAVIRAALEHPDARSGPAYLDTLAAALAEQGDFEEAIRVGTRAARALERSGDREGALDVVRAHLEAYRAGRPVRDPAPAAPPEAP